ncbi:3-hydroxyacyl-CoA dehydrogenase family protein [Roseibium aggregatum]|uniref:Hydrogenase n=1 Tax=Roseibium aggregatum TaxID=187304 RepID=A0A939EFV6_9HYPH|nr:3-hydroxyacyl-CoA dehydrogenase NAD-binding domain-containing protein [Roseibium aggregatum]MBN9671005.1 hydrogenase [Roseibium aggregatum]
MSRVAVVGGGLIGAGWAAAFAGAGHQTLVLDPDPFAADRTAATWEAARDVLLRLQVLADEAVPPLVVARPEDLGCPDFVQEALPERLELKRSVLGALEPQLSPETVIASSSSSFTADEIAEGLHRGENLLIGHPCNPPYLMPVVEIVGGSTTSSQALSFARTVYEGIGKTVLELDRPVSGHLVNRLQAALWREAVHLVASGAASLAETERAVTLALAPRWCLLGPSSIFALAGGDRGMEGFLDALGDPFEALWDDLGTPHLDEKTRKTLVSAFETSGLPSLEEMAANRDRNLSVLLTSLASLGGTAAEKRDKSNKS